MNKTDNMEKHSLGILPTFTAYIEMQDSTLKRLVGLLHSMSQNSFILLYEGSIRNAKKVILDSKVLSICAFSAKDNEPA